MIYGVRKKLGEWLYVKDGARALLKCLELQSGNIYLILERGKGISILDLANLIKDLLWEGEFNFDTTKPEGVLEKVDGSIGKKIIDWEPELPLKLV